MRENVHTIEELFVLLDQLKSYPDGAIQMPGRIPGTAFFPGGLGLWNTQPNVPPPPVPVGGSLIVGHNFDSEVGFQRSFHHAGENLNGATWRTLLAFLKQVGIPPEQCFFTNAYVGLRAGNRAMGALPAHKIPISCAGVAPFFSSRSGLFNPGSSSPWVPMYLGSWLPFPPNYGRCGQR